MKVYNIVLFKHYCQTTSLIFMTYILIIPKFHGSIKTSDKGLVIKPVLFWNNYFFYFNFMFCNEGRREILDTKMVPELLRKIYLETSDGAEYNCGIILLFQRYK